MQIVYKKIADLKRYEKNNKKHPERQEVLSVCITQHNKNGVLIKIYKTKLLKGSIDKYGYKTVRMMVDGKKKHIKVHRLIAGEFLENTLFKPQVNHKDMNKLNNNVENLEWVTDKENKKHYNLKVGNKWNEKKDGD